MHHNQVGDNSLVFYIRGDLTTLESAPAAYEVTPRLHHSGACYIFLLFSSINLSSYLPSYY